VVPSELSSTRTCVAYPPKLVLLMTMPRVWNTEPRFTCIHSPAAAAPAIHPEALSRVDCALSPWPIASLFLTLEYVRVPSGRDREH